jgi:toluene monooxygenase electron transfer component
MYAVRITDGPEYRCAGDDTLLRAALRAGLGVPYECNTGSCGTCKVELVSGEVTCLRPDPPGLGERDRARKRILACQSRPATDCAIKVRLRGEYAPAHRPARFTARLERHRDLTHDLREFRFSVREAPGFLAGQYALFYLPGLESPRTYSMSNVDDGSREWQFVVKRVPGGAGTRALFERVPIGGEITLDGPYGLAYLRTDSPRDIVCIGGGSGLAPVLSVARGAVREPALRDRRIRVFYGARTSRDLCGERELGELPGYGTRVSFQPVLSMPEADPEGAWRGPTGLVHEHVRQALGDRLSDFEYYFAGPPPMTEAVQQMLAANAVPHTQMHYDSFY